MNAFWYFLLEPRKKGQVLFSAISDQNFKNLIIFGILEYYTEKNSSRNFTQLLSKVWTYG